MVKEALVIKRDILFQDKHFQGFIKKDEFDFTSIILNNYFYHERGDKLEYDKSLKQVIPYVLIINKKEKKIFAYRRQVDERYTEKRLRNKWSIGLGGHIERQDDKDPIARGMRRELNEEVKMEMKPNPMNIGYINDEIGNVESVHFAVLYIADTSGKVEKGDEEMAEGRFYSISEFESLFADPNNEFERWSQIAWPVVKEYLLK